MDPTGLLINIPMHATTCFLSWVVWIVMKVLLLNRISMFLPNLQHCFSFWVTKRISHNIIMSDFVYILWTGTLFLWWSSDIHLYHYVRLLSFALDKKPQESIWIFSPFLVFYLIVKMVVNLKLVSTNFYQICISHQMKTFQRLWKMSFISSKKLFSF